ncbi:MAG: ISSpo3, transposase [Candidatus Roizmanbacteria bacterium GW2011_GWA2_35_8]|uniref:ISSpo3, transposase n=1 Tax=Candidatus Roizmanbacteria bacterium GW2011_GWA2_35_8 TaxID=1618479 RepID=A0A0G0CZZ5_9BACT|nr:MAG: ISSpo3, transposase [Candidatus Roizmanbacteria bacterium GW2011_GWA2_35_8]
MDKFTISDFLNRYSTSDKCLEEIKNLRFPEGIKCIVCKKVTNHSWFYAMFLMINTRAGISSKQLQRELGVTYKTAWRIGKQIRTLMADDIKFEDGVVEIDETFVGGKPRMKERWDTKTKEVVMGMVQRDGKAYLRHIENTGKWALLEQIQAHVSPKVRVMTDQYFGYVQLKKHGYKHKSVNHRITYVTKNDVHTQNIENVWSHLKRGIYGVYRHVSKKYLQAYADEFAFRYNNRKSSGQMFFNLLRQVSLVKMISL